MYIRIFYSPRFSADPLLSAYTDRKPTHCSPRVAGVPEKDAHRLERHKDAYIFGEHQQANVLIRIIGM